MSNTSGKQNSNTNGDDWVVRFLNSPPVDQIQFLYRFSLEESIRKEIENKILGP